MTSRKTDKTTSSMSSACSSIELQPAAAVSTLGTEVTPDSTEMCASYIQRGNEAYASGRWAEAVEFHTLGTELLLAQTPTETEALGTCYLNLGNDHYQEGKLHTALDFHRKAYVAYRKTLAVDHPAVANAMNSLANVHSGLCNWKLALTYQRLAVKCFEELRDPRLPDAYNNLGNIYFQMQKFRNAKTVLFKAKARNRQRESASLGNINNNLGSVFYALKQPLLALKYHLMGLQIRSKFLPNLHPDLANSWNNVGNDNLALGRVEKARSNLEAAVHIYTLVLPVDHPALLTALANLDLLSNLP